MGGFWLIKYIFEYIEIKQFKNWVPPHMAKQKQEDQLVSDI